MKLTFIHPQFRNNAVFFALGVLGYLLLLLLGLHYSHEEQGGSMAKGGSIITHSTMAV
jgi:hypothetical protein